MPLPAPAPGPGNRSCTGWSRGPHARGSPLPSLKLLDSHTFQSLAINLVGAGERQLGQEEHPARMLVRRRIVEHEALDRLFFRMAACPRHDEGHRLRSLISSGTGTTQACATSGWRASTNSTSLGK